MEDHSPVNDRGQSVRELRELLFTLSFDPKGFDHLSDRWLADLTSLVPMHIIRGEGEARVRSADQNCVYESGSIYGWIGKLEISMEVVPGSL